MGYTLAVPNILENLEKSWGTNLKKAPAVPNPFNAGDVHPFWVTLFMAESVYGSKEHPRHHRK